jgi:hypothetical protein
MAAFKIFQPPYNSSSKEPDFCVLPVGLELPPIVIEAGLSETKQRLQRGKTLWLKGGAGDVKLVLLLKWYKRINNRVAGTVKIWELDATRTENLLQSEVLLICLKYYEKLNI